VHPGALNELGRIDLKRNNPRGAIRQFIAAARAAPQEAVYGRNAQVGIFHLLARTCYVLGIACVLMAVAVVDGHLHGAGLTLMLGALGGVIAACAGWVAVRTPPEARRLLVRTLRQPRMAGALAVALGGIVVAVTVISTGSASMPSNVVVVVFTIAGTRIAATVVLRRRKRSR
jgi:hypothetical protein